MDSFPGYGFGSVDPIFKIFMILFFIIFFIAIVIILINVVKGIAQWGNNNQQPMLSVDATVVLKRMNVSRHHNNNMNTTTSRTQYYVTFQVQSGDRMEFLVPDDEYGMIVEGDVGKVTFQGTRFKGFVREK